MHRHLTLLAFGLIALCSATGCFDDGPVLWKKGAQGGGGPNPSVGGHGAPEPGEPPIEELTMHCPPEPDTACQCPPETSCFCDQGGSCLFECDGGACTMDCGVSLQCDSSCPSGGCTTHCSPESECTVTCTDDCLVDCAEGATCTVFSWNAPSQIFCALGAQCQCPTNNCECTGPGNCP